MPRFAISLCAALLVGTAHAFPFKNGFDLAGALVPPGAIEAGGPPRDGIPALDRPRFIAADEARFLRDADRVLGLHRHGAAKAYPIAILNWHEIVNDEIGGEPVVVTYCPLCGTGMAYLAEVAGRKLGFGVSGLLYNSDVLLYDRQTESLWSQILAQAIAGPMKGTRLTMIPLTHTTWADWWRRHPDTQVLSTRTGYARDYRRDPYAGYERSMQIWFAISARDGRYHPKELVIGLVLEGRGGSAALRRPLLYVSDRGTGVAVCREKPKMAHFHAMPAEAGIHRSLTRHDPIARTPASGVKHAGAGFAGVMRGFSAKCQRLGQAARTACP